MSEDPIGFNGGLINLRDYVGNSPTNYADPSGYVGAGAIGWGAGIGFGEAAGATGAAAAFGAGAACSAAGVAGYYVGSKAAPYTSVPLATGIVNLWYWVFSSDPSKPIRDEAVQRRIDELRDKIKDVGDEIASKLADCYGYGKHSVAGSLQNLQQLLNELAQLEAENPITPPKNNPDDPWAGPAPMQPY
jgi:hypothetical protein